MTDNSRENKHHKKSFLAGATGTTAPPGRTTPHDSSSQDSVYPQDELKIPTIELPKGGGALKPIDEKFQVNAANGTASFSVPLPLSKARSDFMPALSLGYNSGSGNSEFGLGWNLSYAFIQRRTDKRLPRYEDALESDVFLLSGAEDLVPALRKDGEGNWVHDEFTAPTGERVKRYRPRIESAFARIEKITPPGSMTSYWRITSKNNAVTIYGKSTSARIADPSDSDKVFRWLPELSYDDKGNCLEYEYLPEDFNNVPGTLPEKNRLNLLAPCANTYLKRVKYGNKNPYYASPAHPYSPDAPVNPAYFFELVLDYGDHDWAAPTPEAQTAWPCRLDPFSEYKAGFEIRTYRLCRRILSFHSFKELNDGVNPAPCLARSLDFDYRYFNNPAASPSELRNLEVDYPIAMKQTGYVKNNAGSYDKKSLPPIEFTYQELDWNKAVQSVTSDNLADAPIGLSRGYQWVDLWSEGISGILSEQANGWFYKSNLGNGAFSPAQAVVPKPSFRGLNKGGLQLQDMEADGRKFIVVSEPPLCGYFELSDGGQWQPFSSFDTVPNVSFNDPDAKFIDLDGDGRLDLVISEEHVFTWYASRGISGYDAAERARKPFEEEKGPALVFSDPTGSVFLANMSGSGLTDIVRVRNGEVCYWPNLGYGRFGAKVIMNFAPVFDTQDLFNPAYIHLADVSGTGATDLLYLGKNKFRAWLNQSGNAWSEEVEIDPFPATALPNQLSVADLLGNGTACLVWSSPLPKYAGSPMRYVDLMGGKKPYVVHGYKNNSGKEIKLEYKSSTFFYLQDKQAGKPWITKLPFPVHCVRKVTSSDRVTGAYLATEYAYHHGYYDHAEREYRGFGLVEQTDTETFDQFIRSGASNIVDQPLHQSPVLTRTWYHTGAFFGEDDILSRFKSEYFQNPDFTEYHLPPPDLPGNISDAQEQREAQRACKGTMIRQEIYGLDGIPGISSVPYLVRERNSLIQMLQPSHGNRYSAFLVTENEAISYYYERNRKDPRIAHTLNLEIDSYGNILQSASVAYPRRLIVPGLPAPVQAEQQKLRVSYSVTSYTNDIATESNYRLRQSCETSNFELTGVAPLASYFRLDELRNDFASATLIRYEETPDGSKQKRRLKHSRTLFLKNDLSAPLSLGQMDSLGLAYESYHLTFTSTLLAALYGTKVSPAQLGEGGYLRSNDYKASGLFPPTDADDEWWTRSGVAQYPPNPASAFYMPNRFLDPFGGATTVKYYADYQLAVQQVTDAVGNTTFVETFDWRSIAPQRVKDVNDNFTEVRFDILGFVVGTAIRGKGGKGDDFAGFTVDLNSGDIANFFSDPVTFGPGLLQHATSRFVYDFSVIPMRSGRIVRETHFQASVASGTASKLQYRFEYSDGFGNVAMRKLQAEPGLAKKLDAGNHVVEVDTSPHLRWLGNGRTVLNNKGKPVKKYEPYFSVTFQYEDDPELVEIGVTPVIYYDPLGRVVRTNYPNGTLSKIEIQGWLVKSYDQNDTVTDSDWYTERTTGSMSTNLPENQAARKATVHYNTPNVSHSDSLGRPFYTVNDNKFEDHTTHLVVEQFYNSYAVLDIEGNQKQMVDALGNSVVTYDCDVLGSQDHSHSADAGERWVLNDCTGKPIYSWDSKSHIFHTIYDSARRPINATVATGANPPILFDQITYGEGQANDKLLNLRGKIYQHRDQAGVLTNLSFDFKGNLLKTIRVMTVDYQHDIDWSAAPALQTEIFTTESEYDALNRPTKIIAPNNSISQANVLTPTYNQASLLEAVDVNLRGSASTTHFVTNIDYNEKGQRERIDYANGASTVYKYDEKTFRLIGLVTARNADPEIFWDDRSKITLPANADKVLQFLAYTYDPVGNITHIKDDAQQTIYFNNQIVEPSCDYTYDAIYRLVQSQGREQIGAHQVPGPFDDARMGNAQPGDGDQLHTYTLRYDYDSRGNLSFMNNVGNWNMAFTYSGTNNQMLTAVPGGAVGTPFTYLYDEHGNVKAMPHLQTMQWDFKDRLRHTEVSASGSISQQSWYVYDSAGQRVRKVVQKSNVTEERLYFGNVEIFRRNRNGSLELERETLHVTDDSRRIAMVDSPTVKPSGSREARVIRYQYSNHLGTACLELDDTAQIISYEEYYAFGSTSYQGTDKTREVPAKRYRYTGKERDEETGFYYHGARYYAPWLARWTAADPAGIADGLNVYTYVSDNPVILHDPRGTDGEVCGVYDEEQLVCREEPCVPACMTPEVPASPPSSPTAPRPRIRVQPRRRHTAPPHAPSGGHSIAAPPPVSGTDYTLYVPHGFAYTQYQSALREMNNPGNPMGERITMGVLAGLSEPLALAEEYIARPIANIPFTMHNAGIQIGEHSARAYMWAKQGEYGEMTLDILHATKSGAEGFNAGLSVGIPVSGALENRMAAAAPTVLADTQQVATTWQEHEQLVTQNLQSTNPAVNVGRQVTLDVTNSATGDMVTIRIDNTVPTSSNTYQLIDAKFSSTRDLTTSNLQSTVTQNQSTAYGWISSGQPVSVLPRGARAIEAGMTPGTPINVEPNIQIHVNSPGGIVVRHY